MLTFLFKINPVPAARPRVSRWSTYYPKTYTEFREEIVLLMKEYPRTLIKEPIKATIKFYKRIPGSVSLKKRAELEGAYCVSNFDLDNLEKAIYDAMNDHVFVDDCQIVEHQTSKYWSSNPRIEVTITPIL